MIKRSGKTIFFAGLILLCISGCMGKPVNTQVAITENNYTILSKKGETTDLQTIVEKALQSDVVLIGETHNDPAAHHLEQKLLEAIHKRVIDGSKKHDKKKVVLSLEMFESDVQHIVDEYLKGMITKEHFVFSSRAWPNYKKAYHPLIAYAKNNNLKVVAANAPRRYVNMVARLGRGALDKLSDTAKSWLAPLPYMEASEDYKKKLDKLRNKTRKKPDNNHGKKSKLPPEKAKKLMKAVKQVSRHMDHNAQALWDATMAWNISKTHNSNPDAIIININGKFHSEEGLGIPEHLLAYNRDLRVIVVTIKKEVKLPDKPPLTSDDFTIFTNHTD